VLQDRCWCFLQVRRGGEKTFIIFSLQEDHGRRRGRISGSFISNERREKRWSGGVKRKGVQFSQNLKVRRIIVATSQGGMLF